VKLHIIAICLDHLIINQAYGRTIMKRITVTMAVLFVILVWSGSFFVFAKSSDTDRAAFEAIQGEILKIEIPVPKDFTNVKGVWKGQPVIFFRFEHSNMMGALLGIDLASKLGKDTLDVTLRSSHGVESRQYFVDVRDANFPVQTLTLPSKMVDLDSNTLKRVQREARHLRSLFTQTNTPRMWGEGFIVPLEGKISDAFGRKRIINGQKKNPHTGEDISAPHGAEVKVSNHGIVRLSTDQFFSGKSILVDHGLGLFTMYFHLSEMKVKEGETVRRGQVIGLVGASGRATGPHLHWGARLNNARVDPYDLMKIKAPVETNITLNEVME